MSSEECAKKKAEFADLKNKLSGLTGYISSCNNTMSDAKDIFSNIIICSEPLDNGKIESIISDISSINSDISTMMAECDEKIKDWETKYQEALEAERRAAEKKKESFFGRLFG